MTTRREWMKSALLFTAAMPITSLTDQLMAAPVSNAEKLHNPLQNKNKLIRLGSNENPYGPSAKAKEAITSNLVEGNRYPFAEINAMKKLLAEHEGVSPDHIMLGVGSSELLCLSGMGVGLEGGSVLSAFPMFPLLMRYAEVFNARWDKVNLDDTLTHNLEALASAIKKDTRLLFLINPNNPTGTRVDSGKLKDFCIEASKKCIVYADEAYLEFLEPDQQISMVSLVRDGYNVIVSRTFSKIYGLAGLRIGYIVAKPELIQKLESKRTGTILSQTALEAAKASLNDKEFMNLTRRKNAEARKHLTDYLDGKKFFYGKSLTNKVFFSAPKAGSTILNETEKRGFQIRIWEYQNREWCRVSIGTLEEMKAFTKAFDEIIS
jgi:histidinol-phosphate aminotransferase